MGNLRRYNTEIQLPVSCVNLMIILFTLQAVRELKMCTDFSDYPQPLQYSLCKVGWYLRYACTNQSWIDIINKTHHTFRLGHGRVIFREHSPAECFYFIISGNGLHRIVNCVYNIMLFYVVVATSEQEPAQTLTAGASFGVRWTFLNHVMTRPIEMKAIAT